MHWANAEEVFVRANFAWLSLCMRNRSVLAGSFTETATAALRSAHGERVTQAGRS